MPELLVIWSLAAVAAYEAHHKGYNAVVWFLSGGLLSLLIVYLLPDTRCPLDPPERRAAERFEGNLLGAALALGALWAMALLVP